MVLTDDESPFASSSCDTESMSLQDSLTPPSRKSNRHGDDLSRNDEPDEVSLNDIRYQS